MSVKTGTALLAKAGAIAVMTAGLVAGAHSASAETDAASISVDPSSGLPAVATVTATVSGLVANQAYWVGQCGMVGTGCAGNPETVVKVTTDADGSATTQVEVNENFVGNVGTGVPVSVDCAEVQCMVGVYNADVTALDRVAIDFE